MTVLTSTSRDARRWDDHYPEGLSLDGDVRVRRFRVQSRASRTVARALESARHLAGRSPVTLRQAWTMWANPWVPGLVEHLDRHSNEEDAVFFFTYYYYPSIVGAQHTHTVRVGVPLGHDDAEFHSEMIRGLIRQFDAIVANSDDERALIERHLNGKRPPIHVAGCGIDPPPSAIGPAPIDRPYVVYLGREKDGTELLPRAITTFRRRYGKDTFTARDGRKFKGNELLLVTVGEPAFEAGKVDGMHVVGRVEDAERWAWIAGAEVLVNPSLYESLSLTLLEAWWVGLPVLARAQCGVMANQVARTGGGATFTDPESFADVLVSLLRDPDGRAQMGVRGQQVARLHYGWPTVIEHYVRILADIREGKLTRGQDSPATRS